MRSAPPPDSRFEAPTTQALSGTPHDAARNRVPAREPDHAAPAWSDEHADDILRLRALLGACLIIYPLLLVADATVALGRSTFPLVLLLLPCSLPWIVGLLGWLRLRRLPRASPSFVSRLDFTVSVGACLGSSWACALYGSLDAPFASQLPMFLLARALFLAQHWRRSVFPVVACAICYPSIVLLSAYWRDPTLSTPTKEEWVLFEGNLMGLGGASLLALLGGHRVWALRVRLYAERTLGCYRLIRLLGAGGMGQVWLAEHRRLKRLVAVKVMLASRGESVASAARFEREVQTTARLTHPNTVRVYDCGTADDGVFFYAMEYVEGHDLAQLVELEGPLEPFRACWLIAQLCGALAEAHDRGIVHRDLKPSNVMVTHLPHQGEVAKVLDFGIAKVLDEQGSLTRTGAFVGTPRYASPEVRDGEPVDARADVYGLGACLFFALTGVAPGGGSTTSDQGDDTRPITHRPSRLQALGWPELDAVVARCLEREPCRRFEGVLELSVALEDIMVARRQRAVLAAERRSGPPS